MGNKSLRFANKLTIDAEIAPVDTAIPAGARLTNIKREIAPIAAIVISIPLFSSICFKQSTIFSPIPSIIFLIIVPHLNLP